MKSNKGITLVSLVVTIIVLIILAGVSINLVLGENGIITKSKQAKQKSEEATLNEQTALNELYVQMEAEEMGLSGASNAAVIKLAEFKKAIADYIGEAGGVQPAYTADETTFGDSIKNIVTEVTKDATATAADILSGKTAYINGQLVTGTYSPIYSISYKCWSTDGYFFVTTPKGFKRAEINITRNNNYFIFNGQYLSTGTNSLNLNENTSYMIQASYIDATITLYR